MNLKEFNMKILKKARKITYGIAVLLLLITLVINYNFSTGVLDYFGVANANGYLAFTFLSLALAVASVMKLWPKFALNSSLFLARRAIGVSAFGFAAVHGLLLFVYAFGASVANVLLADNATGGGLILGSISLFFLFILTCTSTDWAQRTLGKLWYKLHMLTYLAYVLVFAHAIKIGVDFKSINVFSGSFLLIALITLLLVVAKIWVDKTTPKPIKPVQSEKN